MLSQQRDNAGHAVLLTSEEEHGSPVAPHAPCASLAKSGLDENVLAFDLGFC